MFDPDTIKKDFPILAREINGHPLVYLDSGASSQKPKQVIEAISLYYTNSNANVHRGAHTLGDEATQIYQDSREKVARFIGAKSDEVIFVRNTTEAINLVADAWGMENLTEGDLVVSTIMEHHANLVPWQEICRKTGAKLKLVKLTSEGVLDLHDFEKLMKQSPKIVCFAHVSNTLGTTNPVKEMTKMAHKVGAIVLVDGAQAAPHLGIDVGEIGCDFYAFSGHKMLGPMGIGVLWGRRELLEKMAPFMTGGGMINEVFEDHATWAELPDKFEAGTPNVEGAVGLASAIDYLEKIGMAEVREHDKQLTAYSLQQLGKLENIKILGPKDSQIRSGSVSFEYKGVHAHDVATILDSEGVATRSGHHCTMPLHKMLGIAASVRASFNVYTTQADIDTLVLALGKVKQVFGR